MHGMSDTGLDRSQTHTGNGYLREAASEPTALPDYVARPGCVPSSTPQQQAEAAPAFCIPAGDDEQDAASQLTTMPQGVLEDILARCSLEALCIAATTCKALYTVR